MAAIRIEDLPGRESLSGYEMGQVLGGYQMEYYGYSNPLVKPLFGVVTSGEVPATDMDSTSYSLDGSPSAPSMTVVTIAL
ncbi:MAG: hypothetical protein HY319_31305 [Armatimonadetes bacterium]|nr:hypothetical protein [Armatimonadota bacterium]